MPVRELLPVPNRQPNQRADEVEELEYNCCLEASLASLELIRDSQAPVAHCRRVVAAVELPGHYSVGEAVKLDWEYLDALLIDDEDAAELVHHICQLQSQDLADAAVEELLEGYPLVWWDRAERRQVSAQANC